MQARRQTHAVAALPKGSCPAPPAQSALINLVQLWAGDPATRGCDGTAGLIPGRQDPALLQASLGLAVQTHALHLHLACRQLSPVLSQSTTLALSRKQALQVMP